MAFKLAILFALMGCTAPLAGHSMKTGLHVGVSNVTFELDANTLRDDLMAELKRRDLYDPEAKCVIEGHMTGSTVTIAGTGRISARFSGIRDGKLLFEKEVVAEGSSAPSGTVEELITVVTAHFLNLSQTLVSKFIDDPHFLAPLARCATHGRYLPMPS